VHILNLLLDIFHIGNKVLGGVYPMLQDKLSQMADQIDS
jgi:hypothetical protein